MISTSYGDFDGDSWEQICQICFKIKYANEQYVEMKASPGDFGIEGFTKSGKVFQCYCPEKDYAQDELYKKQRDKITKDLLKLEKYEKQIVSRIGPKKITEWNFYTPFIYRNDIAKHCESKSVEYKSKKLSFLHDDFTVLPRDIEHLLPELNIALGNNSNEISLISDIKNISEKVSGYKKTDGNLVANALNKHTTRLSSKILPSGTVDKFTDNTIQRFLDGASIINSWKNLLPEEYEKFQRIVSLYERRVEEKCISYSGNPDSLLDSLRTDLEGTIKENFKNLSGGTILALSDYVIADWILRCPINFT